LYGSIMEQAEKKAVSEVTCTRCGRCCLANVLSFVNDADLERWRMEGRDDILHVIENWHPVWAGDHLISSETGRYLHTCPFLKFNDRATCTIYETRPDVCRNYRPGSSRICPQWKGD